MHLGRPAESLGGGFGEAEEAHLPGDNEVAHRANGVFDGHLGINAVLVVEVDHVHAEPLQAGVAGGAHVFGPPIDAEELAGRVTDVAELRGQHDLAAPVANGLPDQRLVGAQAIHVRRVQEVHPQVEGAVDRGQCLRLVAWAVELRHAHAAQTRGLRPSFRLFRVVLSSSLIAVGCFAHVAFARIIARFKCGVWRSQEGRHGGICSGLSMEIE